MSSVERYRPEIDGLRALAVLPVIGFHAGLPGFDGGYLGVDVFFVISGYLITNILLEDKDRGNFSLVKFYERRARRILPALTLVVLCCVPFALLWMPPLDLKIFGESVAAVALFSSNFLFWLQSGYFEGASEMKPLLHTWSLGVEEQFYLLFPLLLHLALRGRQTGAVVAIGIACVGSLALSQWLSGTNASANFFLAPSRVWELLAGALCAFALRSPKAPGQNDGIAAGGLILLLVSMLAFSEETPSPSIVTMAPVLGTVLLVLCARKGSATARLLAWPALVAVGLMSYSAYLWHQPLFAFARLRLGELSTTTTLCLIALTFALAYLSWRFVETPFRTRRWLKTTKQVFIGSAAATAAMIAIGVGLYIAKGMPGRTAPNGQTFSEIQWDERLQGNYGLDPACDGAPPGTLACQNSDSPEVLLWGDSHAMHLAGALLSSEPSLGLLQRTKSVCSPLLGVALTNLNYSSAWAAGCIAYNRGVLHDAVRKSSLRYAVLSSPFEIATSAMVEDSGNIVRSGQFEVSLTALRRTVNELRKAGIRPVVISSPPGSARDVASCLRQRTIFGGKANCRIDRSDFSEQYLNNRRFLAAAEAFVPVLRLEEFLCDKRSCATVAAGTLLYRDSAHLSLEGAEWLGRKWPIMRIVRSCADNSHGGCSTHAGSRSNPFVKLNPRTSQGPS